jgi:hypothetical protein
MSTQLRFTLAAGGLAALLSAPTWAQTVYTVNTLTDTPDATLGDGLAADAGGLTSLRAAVQEANAAGGFATIKLQKDALYTLAIAGAGEDAGATGDLDVSARIVLQGFGAAVDAAGLDRAFDVLKGGRLEVSQLDVMNGFVSAESGAGYRSAGELLLSRAVVQDSTAAGTGASGGAVFNAGGFLFVDRGRFFGDEAERAGGAIEAMGGTTVVERSEFMDNAAGPTPGNGGAIHLTGTGSVTVRTSSFEGNVAAREGGALWNSSTGTMSVEGCTILGNMANGPASDDGGGGLFNDGGLLQVTNTTVSGNSAPVASGSGGGLFNNAGVLRVERSVVDANVANRAGGGIEALTGNTLVRNTKLRDNAAGPMPGNGGGLHLTGEGTVAVAGCDLLRNVAAAEGGGLWNSSTGNMSVTGCTIQENTASGNDADQGGGGVFSDGGSLRIEDCNISSNVADGTSGSGGGVLNNQGLLLLVDSTLSDNVSMRAGGGVEANVGTTSLLDVVLDNNTTGSAPGNGGGLHLTGAGFVTITDGAVTKNDAANEGGGLWNSSTGTMHVAGTKITGNTAPKGPDLFNQGGTFTVDGVDVPVGP